MNNRSSSPIKIDEFTKEALGHDSGRAPSVVDTPDVAEDDYPDGGLRAWLVVLGGLCSAFSTLGYINSWGVFQAYYERTLLQEKSASNIAWIGSLQFCLTFFLAMITGRLFDMGYLQPTYALSSTLLVVSTVLIGECKQYWQLVLSQGLAVGIATGFTFSPTLAVVSHWFKRRRGLAIGITSAGASVGGTVVPVLVRRLIILVGFPWTMRIVAVVLAAMLGIANLTLRRRLPPVKSQGRLVSLKPFRFAPYSVYALCALVIFMGIYTVLVFIDSSAIQSGIDDNFSFYLVAAANGSSGIGRIIGGHLADLFGPVNVMIPMSTITAAVTYAWPFAHARSSLMIVAIIYGFSLGAFVALLPHPVTVMGPLSDLGQRLGMSMGVLSIGALLGPPISGILVRQTSGFQIAGIYAGSVTITGLVLMGLSKYLMLGSLRGKF